MAILAFDTTTDKCSVACLHQGVVAKSVKLTRSGRGAPPAESMAAVLVPMLQDCLAQHGIGFVDVATIMLPRGPGSFTGIRIGFSVMHGLAIAHSYKVIAPTMFDVWAHTYSDGRILMLLDNKQGRFYAAAAAAGKVDYDSAGVMSMSEVEAIASDYDVVLADHDVTGAIVPEHSTAEQLLNMAHQFEKLDSQAVQPYYLHNPAFKKLL